MSDEQPPVQDEPPSRPSQPSPRPKGERRASAGPADSAKKDSIASPPGWVTYIALISSTLIAVVSLVIAIGTTKSNHTFEKKLAATQDARTQKYAAYPKLQGDLLALEKAVGTCQAAEEQILLPGEAKIVGTTNQETWFQQRVIDPANEASAKLLADSRTLASSLSPAVRKIVHDMQEMQQTSVTLCIHYTAALRRLSGSPRDPGFSKDANDSKASLTKIMQYLKEQDTQLDKDIMAEIAER